MFRSQLAPSVFRIWLGCVALTDLLVGLLLLDGSEDAEAADKDKAFQGHPHFEDSLCQILGSFGIDAMEVLFVQTLRHTGGMHHIVEVVSPELFYQLYLRREVEFDEMDPLVLQIFLRTVLAHRCPGFEASLKGFFHDKGTDKSACACD